MIKLLACLITIKCNLKMKIRKTNILPVLVRTRGKKGENGDVTRENKNCSWSNGSQADENKMFLNRQALSKSGKSTMEISVCSYFDRIYPNPVFLNADRWLVLYKNVKEISTEIMGGQLVKANLQCMLLYLEMSAKCLVGSKLYV